MARLKAKEIKKMGKNERDKKLAELKLELVKAKGNASKSGSAKIGEAKRTIARIYTINKSLDEELKNK